MIRKLFFTTVILAMSVPLFAWDITIWSEFLRPDPFGGVVKIDCLVKDDKIVKPKALYTSKTDKKLNLKALKKRICIFSSDSKQH